MFLFSFYFHFHFHLLKAFSGFGFGFGFGFDLGFSFFEDFFCGLLKDWLQYFMGETGCNFAAGFRGKIGFWQAGHSGLVLFLGK